jgi:glutamyl-Q tRNA(Asp) synthetase
MDQLILQQLTQCGLQADAPPVWQSLRSELYQQTLEQLTAKGQAYPCTCTRQGIEAELNRLGQAHSRHAELIYPGICRHRRSDGAGEAWRLRTDTGAIVHWDDRRLGVQQQDVETEVGDFVLKRADGCFSYQLAVVLDDAAQGITDVVRGEDLTANTARQILLQRCLGLPTPRYLHTPLVLGPNREKLSKQNGAQAIDGSDPLSALNDAARVLGLPACTDSVVDALGVWVKAWEFFPGHHLRLPTIPDSERYKPI